MRSFFLGVHRDDALVGRSRRRGAVRDGVARGIAVGMLGLFFEHLAGGLETLAERVQQAAHGGRAGVAWLLQGGGHLVAALTRPPPRRLGSSVRPGRARRPGVGSWVVSRAAPTGMPLAAGRRADGPDGLNPLGRGEWSPGRARELRHHYGAAAPPCLTSAAAMAN